MPEPKATNHTALDNYVRNMRPWQSLAAETAVLKVAHDLREHYTEDEVKSLLTVLCLAVCSHA